MSNFTEVTYISQFDIQPNGCIGVRKTTDVLKDGVVISSTYWRCVLAPNDPQASTVLDEAYYLYCGQVWSGYSQSVVLEDDVVLTVAGTSDHPEAAHRWDAGIDHSDIWAIRWNLV